MRIQGPPRPRRSTVAPLPKKERPAADGFSATRAPKTVLRPPVSGTPFTFAPVSKPLNPASLSMEDRGFLRIALERLLAQAHKVGGELAQRFGGGSSLFYHQGLFGDSSKDPGLFHAVNQVINDGEYSNEKQFFQNDQSKIGEFLRRGGPLVQAIAEFAARAGLSDAFPELKQRTTPPQGTPVATRPVVSTPGSTTPAASAWQAYQAAYRANPFSQQVVAAREQFVKSFTGEDVRRLLGQTRNQAEEYAVYKALTQSGLGFGSNNDAVVTWREVMREKYGSADLSRLINYYEQDSGTPHNNVTLDWNTGEFVSDPRWKWDEMSFHRHASESANPAFAGFEGSQADILQRRKIVASWL